jgi:transcriptional regulator GlxA family with amidase domain
MARPVLFIVLPNLLMLDLAGPAEVLRLASKLASPNGLRFDLAYASPAPSVTTSIGLPLMSLPPLPERLVPGTLVVLAGVTAGENDQQRHAGAVAAILLDSWLRQVWAPSGERLLCVCAGALNAARAGLLDGLYCTTHHGLCEPLRALAPRARVLEDRLYVTDGRVSTSAGVTAGIDMMLQWVAELGDARLASAVARELVVYMRRGGGDPQLSAWTSGRNHLHPALHRVQDAISAAPCEPWDLTRMAGIACTSGRHLNRLFQEHAGVSPLAYLHRLRIAVARDLLAQSTLDMEIIAERAGFGSARQLRRVWRKYDASPPSLARPNGQRLAMKA